MKMNKKIIASVLAVAFAFSMVGSASAVTVEELQALYNDLLAKYELLLAQVGQPTTTTGLCLSSDLKFGMTSAEVKVLQQGLNQDPATQVAVSGAGSPGYETSYFGALTKAAVIKFQDKYASEVLASWGLTKGTGYVGSTTRAKFNALYCTPVPTTTTTVAPETTTTTVAPSYGTLSVVSYPVSNPQTTLYGANTYETVAGQYKATGSDMTVKKVGVKITSNTATTFPWQAFSAISVWDGATMLAELPVTSANAIENTWAKEYTFNLSGFNWVIPNGTQKVLTVKVTTVASPVTAATAASPWTVSLLTDVVSSDTAGVTYSTVSGSAITSGSLTLSSAQASKVTVTAAVDNPLEGNVIGSTSGTTKVDVLKFNVKVENVNATFNSGTIKVQTDGTVVKNDYVTSLELWDGPNLVAAAAPSGWDSNVGTSTWSNFTLPIAAGTTKTLTVKAVLAQLPSDYTN
ncbi:MAG TPA: peptidoglycan-binding protein, partial [candidate division WWE3 bacterium]|nr:peptidoglycan-binding protein [candidate division WWE3 bacterium]